MNKITTIPTEVLPKLTEARKKWLNHGLSTERIDRAKVEHALTKIFTTVSLPRPHFVILLRSPLEIAIAIALLRSGAISLDAQVRDQVSDQVGAQVGAQVRDQVSDQVSDQVRAQVRDQVGDQVSDQVSDQVRDIVNNWRWWYGFGQFESWWLSYYDFMGQLGVDVSRLDGMCDFAQSAGWSVLFLEWAFVSERPIHIRRDDQNRLHCMDGSAIEYPDGFAVYSVHGVRVPAWIILRPQDITVAKIEAENNAEIRRIMVDKYGIAKYLMDSGAEELQRDEVGILYRKGQPNDEDLVMVHVVNSTAEPDGSVKEYFLRVHPDLRPLPTGDLSEADQQTWLRNQRPQELTARNAVASTFGLRGEDYAPAIES